MGSGLVTQLARANLRELCPQILRQVIKMNAQQLSLINQLLIKLFRRVIETESDDFMLQRFGRKTLLSTFRYGADT